MIKIPNIDLLNRLRIARRHCWQEMIHTWRHKRELYQFYKANPEKFRKEILRHHFWRLGLRGVLMGWIIGVMLMSLINEGGAGLLSLLEFLEAVLISFGITYLLIFMVPMRRAYLFSLGQEVSAKLEKLESHGSGRFFMKYSFFDGQREQQQGQAVIDYMPILTFKKDMPQEGDAIPVYYDKKKSSISEYAHPIMFTYYCLNKDRLKGLSEGEVNLGIKSASRIFYIAIFAIILVVLGFFSLMYYAQTR